MHGNGFKDLTGQHFGYLIVLGFSHTRKGHAHWFCRCACGKEKTIPGINLRSKKSNRTTSCGTGCAQRKHGMCNNGKVTSEYKLFHLAKHRAESMKLPFTLVLSDIKIPKICPLLGIPIVAGSKKRTENSPTLDRLIGDKGYTPNNVIVVSWRANRIKNDASLDELKKLTTNLEACLAYI